MNFFSYKSKTHKSIAYTMVSLVFVLGMTIAPQVLAGEAEDVAAIKKVLTALMPQAQADSIKPAAFPGMYEAIYGPQIIYISADGRFMLEGDLYDLKNRINLTETKRQVGRAKVVDAMDDKGLVMFAPEKDKIKYTITAFTDIDCGYCRKLHREMKEYNDLGIAIRYAAYPRSGVDTPSYFKAVSVWCAKDQQAAMTESKAGTTLPRANCQNPIKDHMAAAKLVGVTGTPTLVLEGGRVIPGYVEPKRLLKILQQFEGES